LPTGLSLDDLKPTVLLAHELIQNRIPADHVIFALCRVGDRENEIAEACAYITRAGYRVLAGELPERTGYRRASDQGRAASETTHPSLRERAERLAQSVIDFVTSASKGTESRAEVR
jgi:chromosome partitioning protein